MQSTNLVINQYARQGHPLATGFTMEDAHQLSEKMVIRLGGSKKDFDLSPTSLKRLEQKLAELHQFLQQQNKSLDDEELLQLIREIGAYFGLVLVHHAEGQWRTLGTLWLTEVLIEGPIKVMKESQSRISPYPLVLSLGNQAATAWDLIMSGEKPGLYSRYLSAKRKSAKERL